MGKFIFGKKQDAYVCAEHLEALGVDFYEVLEPLCFLSGYSTTYKHSRGISVTSRFWPWFVLILLFDITSSISV